MMLNPPKTSQMLMRNHLHHQQQFFLVTVTIAEPHMACQLLISLYENEVAKDDSYSSN